MNLVQLVVDKYLKSASPGVVQRYLGRLAGATKRIESGPRNRSLWHIVWERDSFYLWSTDSIKGTREGVLRLPNKRAHGLIHPYFDGPTLLRAAWVDLDRDSYDTLKKKLLECVTKRVEGLRRAIERDQEPDMEKELTQLAAYEKTLGWREKKADPPPPYIGPVYASPEKAAKVDSIKPSSDNPDSYEKSARWHEAASKTAAPRGKTYKAQQEVLAAMKKESLIPVDTGPNWRLDRDQNESLHLEELDYMRKRKRKAVFVFPNDDSRWKHIWVMFAPLEEWLRKNARIQPSDNYDKVKLKIQLEVADELARLRSSDSPEIKEEAEEYGRVAVWEETADIEPMQSRDIKYHLKGDGWALNGYEKYDEVFFFLQSAYKEATMTLPSETDYPLIGSWFTPIRSIATSAGVTARDSYENVKAKIYGEVMDMAEQLSVTPKVKTKLDVDRLRELNIWIKQFGWYET